ncbi:aminotransferase class I/II-fold pyridoxal phosphate-dependent enzyme [Parasalinivibrio latis]|uniref:serine hydroxymethyltransferase n=1 Tax=Parasalinivibrio latis TaxID=2952610 RepID=UPI0030DE4709
MDYFPRPWMTDELNAFAAEILAAYDVKQGSELVSSLYELAAQNRDIHEKDCLNLNPATNIMNPKAEALLASGLGSRPSLGYPGDKYEMGLEAIEKIELIAAQLACEVFESSFAEIRVSSGAMANLYAFIATTKPGDTVLVPPASIGGHVTHHLAGAAGLYGLNIVEMAVDSQKYTVDTDALARQVKAVKPALITIGGSLNLLPHPVACIREIADEVGAYVMFDAAHQCGVIAGKSWPNPLAEGAHLMTMSTYKSLGGPPGGLIVSNDASLMERIDVIAFPGLTANFDVAKSAALAASLVDWKIYGEAYSRAMISTSAALAQECQSLGMPVFRVNNGNEEIPTTSHQFAIEAVGFGGGQAMAKQLRKANILTCGIGLPVGEVAGDMNGLRLGTPEIVRAGMNEADMQDIARFFADCLLETRPLSEVAKDVSAFRRRFTHLAYVEN